MQSEKPKRFAMTGVAGFVAPRHLKAIQETGNTLVAALDPHDSVGILDSYFPECNFFTETERFERHLEKLKRSTDTRGIDYLSICSPNYLHDAHIRMALRLGADAICEKPLVLNPWNLDLLSEMEKETGKSIFTVLQLRLHPKVREILKKADTPGQKKSKVNLVYIAPRGKWYAYSWKGDIQKSGGIATNIGIHFFDMLIWIFGRIQQSQLLFASENTMVGTLVLERAEVQWVLSTDAYILPNTAMAGIRQLSIDGQVLNLNEGFTDLHTEVYQDILKGQGYGIEDARASIEAVYLLRHTVPLETNWTLPKLSKFVHELLV